MKNTISTTNAPDALGPYSQGIDAGSIEITSGQVPVDPATSAAVEGAIAKQTRQSLTNVQAVLAAAFSVIFSLSFMLTWKRLWMFVCISRTSWHRTMH